MYNISKVIILLLPNIDVTLLTAPLVSVVAPH